MSNLVHCDGPNCDNTEPDQRRLCDAPWLRVEQGGGEPALDFCSRACLAAWSADQNGDAKKTVVVEEPAEVTEIHGVTGTHHKADARVVNLGRRGGRRYVGFQREVDGL